jgi:hypothetical protein
MGGHQPIMTATSTKGKVKFDVNQALAKVHVSESDKRW